MEVVYTQCCGLDVHKKMVVACLIILDNVGQRKKEMRTFRTTTQELLLLLDWLVSAGCTHVAMEATGVYWKPIYNVLDGAVELLVVNARHIKAVPGRKTDVRDTSHRGLECAQATMKAGGSDSAARRVKAVPGYANFW
jgi:transposase